MTGQELIDFIKKNNAENLQVCMFADGAGPVKLTWHDVEVLNGNYIVDLANPENRELGNYLGIGAFSFLSKTAPAILDDGFLTDEEALAQDRRHTMTVDQIVEDIIADVVNSPDRAHLDSWLTTKKEELILGHHTVGRFIRNTYGLWLGNPCVGNKHPDDVSMEIINLVWQRIQDKNK